MKLINIKTQIIYSIIPNKRRKNIGIKVLPNLSVEVLAPINYKIDEINLIVNKYSKQILQRKAYFSKIIEFSKISYDENSLHWLRGNQYNLKFIKKYHVKSYFTGNEIVIEASRHELRHVTQILDCFYRREAKKIFQKVIDNWFPKFERFGADKPILFVKKINSRWGSLSVAGRINLNLRLIAFPDKIIELVIIHELCHLQEHNHAKGFYTFLENFLPDWEIRELELKQRMHTMII